MKKPRDTIDTVLDRLSDMREELLSIQRSIERIYAAQQRDRAASPIPADEKTKLSDAPGQENDRDVIAINKGFPQGQE